MHGLNMAFSLDQPRIIHDRLIGSIHHYFTAMNNSGKVTEPTENTSRVSSGPGLRENWLNWRKKRFWLGIALLLYTLLGFFLAPVLVRDGIINAIHDELGRESSIGKVEVNPFVLSLRIQDFEMRDTDQVKMAAFDEYFVNFQLSSLFRWAWVFREIRLAGPYFFFERLDTEDTRLGRILAEARSDPPQKPKQENGGLPRLLVHNIDISDGRVDVRDNVPATPVEAFLAPIDVSIQELNTLPDQSGRQDVNIRMPNGATLHWEGSLSLAPLDSEGELVLKDTQLDKGIAYLKAMLPLESFQARLTSRLHYRIRSEANGEISVAVDDLEVELDDLAVSGLTPTTEFLVIPKISLRGGKLRYPEQSMSFGSVQIDTPQLTAWRRKDGSLSLNDLIPAASDSSKTASKGDNPPWHFTVDEFILDGGILDLSDHSVEPPAAAGIRDLQVKLQAISNNAGAVFPFDLAGGLAEGGQFRFSGQLGVLPGFSLNGTSEIQGIPLMPGQPYLQQSANVTMESGAVDAELEVSLNDKQDLSVSGAVRIPGLDLRDSVNNQALLAWKNLDIDRFEFELNSGRVHFSSLVFDQPFGRLVINEDRSTNLSGLLVKNDSVPEAPDTTSTVEAETAPFSLIVGGIRIDDGSMDFSDLSLPLPFATHIAGLDGTVSTIATGSSEPANIKLEGQVDEYGLARINGSMNVLDPIKHTDMTVEFRNLLMPQLSPYTVQFAGREIDEGKLDLDLRYAIDEAQLHGQNAIVLSDLVLGAKVDHPDAASLPLGLAVALLKDSNGVIDIDLPVEGNINDPEFQIGGVVWQAISGLITKIVSAPFRLLGGLIGLDSEDLGQFQFLAGRADLTPPEIEKIAQLGEALQQRPELVVEVSGVTDPEIDVPALKYIHLRDTARARLGEEGNSDESEFVMLDAEIRSVVEALFVERFPDITLETLKTGHTGPPADDPEGKPVLDELAYAADLIDRLLASEVISEQDLNMLAQARAEAIRAAFLATGQFDESRIVMAEPKQVESEGGEWVKLELGVVSD
jgi:uncharacterized protein involved in outer membrane biogenesis